MSLYQDFDHLAPPIGADGTPFEYYEQLRDEALITNTPIGWSEHHGGFWVVTGWQAARDVYLDHQNISSRVVALPQYQTSTGNRMILAEEDEPAHKTHRRLVNSPFSPGNAEKIDEQVGTTANELIDGFIDHGRVEFCHVFGDRMTERVAAIMLGLPPDDGIMHRRWTHAATHGIYTDRPAAELQMRELDAYWESLIAEKRLRPTNDVFSIVVHSEIDGEKLSQTQLKDFFTILLLAAIDNTTRLLNTVGWRLAWDHDLRRRLAADPHRIPAAVEEFVRLYAPAVIFRVVDNDVTMHGVEMKKDQHICLVAQLANRDPREFPYPDNLIADRTPNRHLTLGTGIHRCLGLHLVKVELRVAIQELLRRIPTFALDPERKPGWECGQVSGMNDVPIVFPRGGGLDPSWTPAQAST
ncbi:MAG: cytochrome P450 [Gammaproteobacteria bacterium]|jgi:cytochrome P450